MSDKKVNEYALDVGSIIDNSDCTAEFEKVYATRAEAEEQLAFLTSKAQAAASEPCQIESTISETENGVKLTACFRFEYQAETMIFQLAIR
ncbi:hypothetical protein A4G19_08175 [Pasteurellaceae bacterium Macca]|nr:hypothetical protein [Pasteurellaceae bacterium Macca]